MVFFVSPFIVTILVGLFAHTALICRPFQSAAHLVSNPLQKPCFIDCCIHHHCRICVTAINFHLSLSAPVLSLISAIKSIHNTITHHVCSFSSPPAAKKENLNTVNTPLHPFPDLIFFHSFHLNPVKRYMIPIHHVPTLPMRPSLA